MITKGSAQMVSNEDSLFMILPEQAVFGDFNIAFNTKSLVTLRGSPLAIDNKSKPVSREQQKVTCNTMNCEKDVFIDLMELYPETAENIKIRSLEKR